MTDDAFSLDTLETLLQQKATKANWLAITKYLQMHLRTGERNPGVGSVDNIAIAGLVAEATHKWPAWVRYAERPARTPFPCPALVGELYAKIKRWDDTVLTTEMPSYTNIQTLSLQLPLDCCEDLPTQLLAPFPTLTKCILWAGHPDIAVPDPFVARNAFWALQSASEGLFHAHPSLETLEINASAEIDLFDDCIPLEASATRERGQPWFTTEQWQNDIAAWQRALDGQYDDEEEEEDAW